MPDVYTKVTEAAPQVLEGLMNALELRPQIHRSRPGGVWLMGSISGTSRIRASWPASPQEGDDRHGATPNKGIESTCSSVRCAPASVRGSRPALL
jgi:hypothetical protein